MTPILYRKAPLALVLTAALLSTAPARADGVIPETPVMVLDAEAREATMNVRNSDGVPVLLRTEIVNIADDQEDLVLITNPLARVEGGKVQQVRFLLRDGVNITTERLKRVTFEGIKPGPTPSANAQVSFGVMQDIPMIIRPAGLERDGAPWKRLQWTLANGELRVENPSPYVVRLANQVTLAPSGETVDIGATYILPNTHRSIPVSAAAQQGQTSVTLVPGTTYGFRVAQYEAPLSAD